MQRTPGGVSIEGKSPSLGTKRFIDLEIRRNEVLIKIRGESEKDSDVAVGLDDFQDASKGDWVSDGEPPMSASLPRKWGEFSAILPPLTWEARPNRNNWCHAHGFAWACEARHVQR